MIIERKLFKKFIYVKNALRNNKILARIGVIPMSIFKLFYHILSFSRKITENKLETRPVLIM